MTQLADVRKFMEAGDQTTSGFNVRQYALYTGLQLEELAEKLAAIGLELNAKMLDELGERFKQGVFDCAITEGKRVEMLDADVDLTWVSLGAMLSISSNASGAWEEVAWSNMTKINDQTGKMDRDENGKIKKSEHYEPPKLARYVGMIGGDDGR